MQRLGLRDRSLGLLFAGFAVAAGLFAFVGLGRSGYWTDELFTLFVMGHGQGLREVWSRALTDTHPPAYYFLLYGWARLFGTSEAALRLPSAVCAVLAAVLFYFGLRRVYSPTARAFALALALNGTFWFDQSSNVRSYPLDMLISAALLVSALAARRQVEAGRTPLGPLLGLMAAGALGSFCHSYIFLETGLVYVFLVLSVPSAPLRIALVLWGGAIAAGYAAFAHALLGSTQQDVHHMWFHNTPKFFFDQITVAWRVTIGISGAVAATILAGFAWRRRAAHDLPADPSGGERGWVTGLAAFAHLGMFALGVAISLAVAPSMSSQNLAAAAPMLWALFAWLYDLGGPRFETRSGQVVAGLMLLAAVLHLAILPGRFMMRTEDWRGSARYVAALQACAGEPIPIVLPQRFGPDTPFFRNLAHYYFYGRYFPQPARLDVVSVAALTGKTPDSRLAALLAARETGRDPCPVLAWAAHDLEPEDAEALRAAIARRLAPAGVEMRRFDHSAHEEIGYSPWAFAFVYLAPRPGAKAAMSQR